MYQSIVKLFRFGSAASSTARHNRKNPGRAFRPAFDHLEARDIPSVSALRPTLAAPAASAPFQSGPLAAASSQLAVQQAAVLPGTNTCPPSQNCFTVSIGNGGPIAVVALPPANVQLAEAAPPIGGCPAGQNCFSV